MWKVGLLILTALTVTACDNNPLLGPGDNDTLASAAETDCGFVQNAYGQRVSWKKSIPVTLEVDPSYPTEYLETLNKAAQHWNDAAGMTLVRFTVAGSSRSNANQKDSVSTLHWMRTWDKGETLQGLTTLYWSGNQLREADMAINNKNFNFYIDTYQSVKDVHLESLLVHELGHVLGLKHRNTVPSVMWSVLNGAIDRSILTTADRETIKCEY